jgi:mRNA interferase RelE/StbE
MKYQVLIRERAVKALQKINEPYYSKLKTAIYHLAVDPRPKGYIKLKDRTGYRIRVSNYRIVYDIYDDTLIVDVVELGHRKDIYG